MSEINKQIAAQLWEKCQVKIERFYQHLRRHESVDFLGHADITLDASQPTRDAQGNLVPGIPGLVLTLRGLQVKLLKDKARVDMKEEKGQDGKFYPAFFPRTGELRAVITTAVFQHENVLAAIEAVKQMPKPGATQAAAAGANPANPFNS